MLAGKDITLACSHFFALLDHHPPQEQLTAVRGYAVQEATEVEESTLQKLEDLKQEYEVEVEQLGTDLAVSIGVWLLFCIHRRRIYIQRISIVDQGGTFVFGFFAAT